MKIAMYALSREAGIFPLWMQKDSDGDISYIESLSRIMIIAPSLLCTLNSWKCNFNKIIFFIDLNVVSFVLLL
jgi:hypothetical protein